MSDSFSPSKTMLKRGHDAEEVHLPQELSPDLAYLCGILVGDGSICKRKEKHEYLVKCVGNPQNEKELYSNIIALKFKKVFGIDLNIKYHDSNTTYGFILYSKLIYDYLTLHLGLLEGKKDQRLGVPLIFQENDTLLTNFIRGVFDTDGCMTFKRKYSLKQYYPVIILSSKSKKLIWKIATVLKIKKFRVVEIYNYKVMDERTINGFTLINRIELNGDYNLRLWLKIIGFESPKHLRKIKENWEGYSGGWI